MCDSATPPRPPRPPPFPPLAPPIDNLKRISGRAFKAGDSITVKRGELYQVQREIETLEFVRRQTSVPVPEVIKPNLSNTYGWFSMTTLPGRSLTDSWSSMSKQAQMTTRNELRDYLNELRAIPSPDPSYIGSCTGGQACDHRLNNGFPCGPFSSESQFNDYLIGPIKRNPRRELVDQYRRRLTDDHGILFTHADLDGDHILVEPATGKITGIVDWETAGWWPAYWEYIKARYGSRYQPWWKKLVSEVLDHYEVELQVEYELQDF